MASGGSGDARREDLAVWAQAVSLTSATTAWAKILFHRPRPIRYTESAALDIRVDDGLSFPSGHASVAFAAAAHQRRGARGDRGAATLLLTTATATAILRVGARRHFPSDVVAGAALGGAIGWIVPGIYPMR
jgi:membrane-associated phospholipid phosphatase